MGTQPQTEQLPGAPGTPPRRICFDPGETGSATPPTEQGRSPQPPSPANGGEEDLMARIAKLEADNNRLTGALADRHKEQEAAEREAAEKRGEFEKLYGAEVEKAKTLQEQLEAERKSKSALEDYLKSDIEQTLKSIEDEGARKSLSEGLEGLDPVRQKKLLSAFLSQSQSAQMPTAKPGPPGVGRRGVDQRLLSRSGPDGEAYRLKIVKSRLAAGNK